MTKKPSLAETHPELAAQADGWDPAEISAGSNKRRQWCCTNGHKWEVSPNNRTMKGTTGCPFCKGKRVIVGETDLKTLFPAIAAQAYGWSPEDFHAKSNRRMPWKCLEGHQWRAAIYDRVVGDGCPVCSNRLLQKGDNDLATTHPLIARQAFGWDPSTVIDGSHSRREWECELGHHWSATVKKRIARQNCPFCSGHRVLAGFNDLSTLIPEVAAEAYEWDPSTVTKNSGVKRKWKCPVGHIYVATVDKRSNSRGCPTCSPTGFSPGLDGWLYFLEHENWDLFQIGITNYPENRLATHQKLGWEVVDLRGPNKGSLIRQLETDALRVLKRRGAIFASNTDIQKFDGWTEAWTKSSLPVTSIKQLLDWVYEDDEVSIVEKIVRLKA